MTVLVCGGRSYTNWQRIHAVLDALPREGLKIVVGDANGADKIARNWAYKSGVTYTVYVANWDQLGRAAGPMRNSRMLEDGKPDMVIAFPGGRGTADMVCRALAADVKVQSES